MNLVLLYQFLFVWIRGVMTDYEEKFHSLGTPINRCVATKLHREPELPEENATPEEMPLP